MLITATIRRSYNSTNDLNLLNSRLTSLLNNLDLNTFRTNRINLGDKNKRRNGTLNVISRLDGRIAIKTNSRRTQALKNAKSTLTSAHIATLRDCLLTFSRGDGTRVACRPFRPYTKYIRQRA